MCVSPRARSFLLPRVLVLLHVLMFVHVRSVVALSRTPVFTHPVAAQRVATSTLSLSGASVARPSAKKVGRPSAKGVAKGAIRRAAEATHSNAQGRLQGRSQSTAQGTAQGSGRGGGARRRSKGAAPAKSRGVRSFVDGLEHTRLLEHSEEIQLAKAVQTLRRAEQTLHTLRDQPDSACAYFPAGASLLGVRPRQGTNTAADADADAADAGPSAASARAATAEWARALNLTVAELTRAVSEGREAESRIVASNTGLVYNTVRVYKNSGRRIENMGTSEQDLMQEGCIALIKAAEKFDVSLGLRFSTYATFWVKAAVRNAFQTQSRTIRLPQRVQNTYGKIRRASNELSAQSNERPSDHQVSAYMEDRSLTPEKIREVVNTVSRRTRSLDAALRGGDVDVTLADFVRDERLASQTMVVQSMLQADLHKLFEKYLAPEERQVLTLRFGLEDGQARTVRGVGEALGLSHAAAKQRLFAALTKLRKPHVAVALRAYANDAEDDEVAP
uniref:RNA polymerase sigma-70 region 2 domain-containing protein n=1 Tax=Chrysotila carterae TaxID=13221 RepID=A0A7S4C5C9_CHRCT